MNKFSKGMLIGLIMAMTQQIAAITLVYNMRVRRTFSIAGTQLSQSNGSIWIPSLVPIFQNRKRHIVTNLLAPVDVTDNRSIGGTLINVQVIPSRNFWAEITTGVEREHASIKGTSNISTARSGIDDIILCAGGNLYPIAHGQFTVYGLAGLPTRLKVGQVEQFGTFAGTRFFSVGGGAELSYGFIDTLQRSLDLVVQGRLIHFFNRSWEPILPAGSKIQPGNIGDFLATVQYREKKDIFEVGYNPTWFFNQALLLKTGPIETDTYLRHSIYASYSHLFKRGSLLKKPVLLGFGINYSFMDFLDTKSISCWMSLSWIF